MNLNVNMLSVNVTLIRRAQHQSKQVSRELLEIAVYGDLAKR